MSGSNKESTLIVICGPTAVGKTAVSIQLANAFNCPILSYDSRQFYQELKIGNARPTESEVESAEHHFIASRSITDVYTAGIFEADALNKLSTLFDSNDHCVAVGGSGLYIDALCYGIDNIPSDEDLRRKLRERLETEGLEALKAELKEIDPDFYEEGDMQNPRRVMRALEAFHLSGKPYSQLRTKSPKAREFKTSWIGLQMEREELFERINRRVDMMIEDGLIEEAKSLLPHKNLKSLQTVGYRELFAHFEGEYDLEEAVRLIKRNSRRYAKQQIGWFKKNPEVHWFSPNEIDKMISFIA